MFFAGRQYALVSRRIVRPVRELVRSAKQIKEGDYTRHVEVRAHDEIGEISSALNHMCGAISARPGTGGICAPANG